MEPGYEQQTQQYGAPGQGGPEPARPVRAKDAMPRARTGLILLVAFLTELVVIAAADNQWVANKIIGLQINATSRLQDGLRQVGLVYAWRFTPQGGSDPSHLWVSGLALIGTTFVVSLLLILALVRGPVTFGRAFFGSWMSVVIATFLGGYVRALVVNLQVPGQGSRLEQGVFGVLSPSSITFLAGVGLGLIVAIIVGIVAPLTRRDPAVPLETMVPAGGPPEQRQGFFDDSQNYPPWRAERFGPPAPSNVGVGAEQPTTALPNYDKSVDQQHHGSAGQEEQRTEALRPVGDESQATQTTQAHESMPGGGEEHAARGYGAAPQSPYAGSSAARSPAAEQAVAGAPTERAADDAQGQQREGEAQQPEQQPAESHAEPKMAEPAPAQPPSDFAAAGSPSSTAGPQGTAELPTIGEPEQGTAQFPRPPDDEDLDPEHT